jgi:protease-4
VDDAIAAAAKLAKLDPSNVRPLYIEEPLSPWRQMLRDFAAPEESREAQAATDPWSVIIGRPERQMLQAVGTAKSLLTGPSMQVRCLECQSLSGAPRAKDITEARSLLTWLVR